MGIKMSENYVTMAHGSGGLETQKLIDEIFATAFAINFSF